MERDPRKVKGSKREKKPYHIQALKSKGCIRRRSNDMGALGEWPTWDRVRESSVRPEVEGTTEASSPFTGWYF